MQFLHRLYFIASDNGQIVEFRSKLFFSSSLSLSLLRNRAVERFPHLHTITRPIAILLDTSLQQKNRDRFFLQTREVIKEHQESATEAQSAGSPSQDDADFMLFLSSFDWSCCGGNLFSMASFFRVITHVSSHHITIQPYLWRRTCARVI